MIAILRSFLRRRLGPTQAAAEFRWMRDALPSRRALQRKLVARVVHRTPLAYILGTQPFLGLDLRVRPPVLIPRVETEEWAARLIRLLKEKQRAPTLVLDVGTGSGCLGLALANAFPQASVVGLDCSHDALQLANQNARIHRIPNFDARIADISREDFDLRSVVGEAPDQSSIMILANLPYVPMREYRTLEPDVRLWEDARAITDGSSHGIDLFLHLFRALDHWLPSRGKDVQVPTLVMETNGQAQNQMLREHLEGRPWVNLVWTWKDSFGAERVVLVS